MNTKYFYLCLLFLVGFLFATGCKEEDEPQTNSNELANEVLYSTMIDYYLWYNEMPSITPTNYPSPVELLEALRYKPLDRWSYITTKQALAAYYQAGEYVGFGFGTAFDGDNRLWISFIFRDSPLRSAGVDRGWQIAKIDNVVPTPSNISDLFGPAVSGVNKTFTLINHSGETVTQSFSKRVVAMNTVLMDSTYSVGSNKIGYFVLKGFIENTTEEVNSVFNKFITNGVSDVIVDLRYNTGGLVDVATHLGGLIAGKIANGEVFGKFVHNDKQTERDSYLFVEEKPNSILLNRIVFITTGSSASASELLINGLNPLMPVVLVGTTTYGKPVGMYLFTSNLFDWAFVPICFAIVNANGEGYYYDGIPVDIEQFDGINFPFGDLNEPSFGAAYSYLIDGVEKSSMVDPSKKLRYPEMVGLQAEIGAW